MTRIPLRSTVELRVRYPETDQMGVVYHANYLVWCDMGRTELIRRLGKSYAELEREGIFLAVSDASLRYHAPAEYDDLVRVETWVEEVRSRAVTFGYLIARVEGSRGPQKLVSARTTLVATTREGATQRLPSPLLEGLRIALATGGA
ncbi:MAG TPA: thioesterase family protein [Longimicrobiaceae bacterium]|nr:thioesterase family protein [Longimicrobiaceae bacterium]